MQRPASQETWPSGIRPSQRRVRRREDPMRTSSLSRQTIVCRLFTTALLLLFASSARADDRASGVVVDQSGRPIPRALVEVGHDASAASTFTNERGEFDLAYTTP